LIIFERVIYKNFLSTGNTPIEIHLNKSPTTCITGKNGCGKCLDGSTVIDIDISDEDTLQKFGQSAKTTIKDIVDFYDNYPEEIGNISVNTRFGYRKIEYADVTARDSEVVTVTTHGGLSIKSSPEHLFHTGEKWQKAYKFLKNSNILTKNGMDRIATVIKEDYTEDLYDLQVEEVKEFFANDIVSHNSTLLDVITFGLFGKPFRNVNKPLLVNSINNSNLLVELYLSVGKNKYKIVRGIKPNVFEVYENGKLIDQTSAVKDYQKYLEESILSGLNEKVFKQVVVIGSADYTPFMALKTSDRREVIEELLDIKIFSYMLALAKEKLVIIRDKLKDFDYSVTLTEEKIKLYEQNQEASLQKNTEKIAELKAKLVEEIANAEALKGEITLKEYECASIKKKLIGKELVQNSVKSLEKLHTDLNGVMNSNNKQQSFFHNNDRCPTCRQDIQEEHKQKLVSECTHKIAEVSKGLQRVKLDLEKKSRVLKDYDTVSETINNLSNDIYKLTTDKNGIIRFIKSLNQDILNLKNDSKSGVDSKELRTLRETLKSLVEDRKKLLHEQDYYFATVDMLKDGGIKTKIIRQYIPVMNKFINDYLVRFGLPIEFTLDESFNEVIKSRYRDTFQYNSFSEGEKSRVDISVLLAWRQLARSKNTTNTNLLILDETMDSSLDSDATEELLNLILEMDKKTNIFIISHKSDLTDKLRSHIEFEKIGNFSSIKTNKE